MKKFLTLIFLFGVLNAVSQDTTLLNSLKKEVKYLCSQDIPIKKIMISKSGGWLILYGDFGFSYYNLPKTASNFLKNLNEKQKTIIDFAFLSDTAWLCLYEHNAFAYNYKIPTSLKKNLTWLNKNQKILKNLSVFGKKWIILFGKNGFAGHGIPPSLTEALLHLHYQNKTIKQVIIYKNGWIILYDKNGFFSKNPPEALEKIIMDLNKQNSQLNTIFVSGKYFLVIYDKTKFKSNF